LRVLHITRDFPPLWVGGISSALGGLTLEAERAGDASAVISFDGFRPKARSRSNREPEGLEWQGIQTLRVHAPDQLDAALAFALEFGPDLLHVHQSMLWEFAVRCRDALHVPTLKTLHVLQHEQSRLRGIKDPNLSEIAQAKAISQADRVLAPSRAVFDLIQASHPDSRPRLRQVGLGVSDSPQAQQAIEASKASSPRLLYTGRFGDIKGTAELIRAIEGIGGRLPQAEFVVAAGLPHNRRAEARWLQAFENGLSAGVRKRTELLGWLEPHQLAPLYGQATALIVPSWFETFGLVVLEAGLFGLPCVAFDVGGLGELIEDERTGVLVERGDEEGLMQATCALLVDPAKARQMGLNAAVMVRERHLWSAVYPLMKNIHEELVGGV
jgi:glycosyltransferase involved in cell wall biosynthesis